MIPTPTTILTLTLTACTRKIMDEYEYDEGSDLDNWETEQVFQDHEGDDEEELAEEKPTFFDHFQVLVRTMEITRK